VTGWQPHSVRGFLASVVKKKLRLTITSDKTSSGQVYRIVETSSPSGVLRFCAFRQSRSCFLRMIFDWYARDRAVVDCRQDGVKTVTRRQKAKGLPAVQRVHFPKNTWASRYLAPRGGCFRNVFQPRSGQTTSLLNANARACAGPLIPKIQFNGIGGLLTYVSVTPNAEVFA
jgi:hypothetical protein